MFGARVRYGIAFKVNQPAFDIFTRSSYHNFKVMIKSDNMEGAAGCQLTSLKAYAIAESLDVGIYNHSDFSMRQNLKVERVFEGSNINKNKFEILYIQSSFDHKRIAVLIGKRLIKDQFDISELAVYKLNKEGEFVLERQIEYDFDDFTCVQFFFNKNNNNELLFFSATEIFSFNL